MQVKGFPNKYLLKNVVQIQIWHLSRLQEDDCLSAEEQEPQVQPWDAAGRGKYEQAAGGAASRNNGLENTDFLNEI